MTYYNEKKLEIAGFTKIGDDINSIELKKGDIVAFAAVKGQDILLCGMENNGYLILSKNHFG